MSLSRRDALRGLAALAGGAALSTAACGRSRPPVAAVKPRKLVVIFLSGGPDAVLTMDAKRPSEIEPWVDNPLPRDSVIAGNLRLGALWAPLARWAPRMAIVNGVQVESANHFSGTWQLLRLRRRGMLKSPGIIDLVARHHPSPLGSITVGNIFNRTFTPSWLALDAQVVGIHGEQGLSHYDAVPAAERRQLAGVLREHAKAASLRPGDRASYERVTAYLDAIDRVGTFKAEDWKVQVDTRFGYAVTGMQRVLWAFQNDLASSALVYFGFNNFDSHWNNLSAQKRVNGYFVGAFTRFLEEMTKRTNQHGSLLDQTTIVVAGEVGRYPRLNSDEGKDHLPETSVLMMGAGVQTGALGNVIGQTGRDMLGMPYDVKTGTIGGSKFLTLDEVGSTVLHNFGIEPTQYGYTPRPIEALLA